MSLLRFARLARELAADAGMSAEKEGVFLAIYSYWSIIQRRAIGFASYSWITIVDIYRWKDVSQDNTDRS